MSMGAGRFNIGQLKQLHLVQSITAFSRIRLGLYFIGLAQQMVALILGDDEQLN